MDQPDAEISGKKISHGRFGLSDDFLETYQSLDKLLIKNRPATFFFRMQSKSMTPEICPGDILIVDRSLTPFTNALVLITLEGEFHCKRFIKKTNQAIILATTYPHFQMLEASEGLEFWGVVRAIARELV